MKQKYFWAIGAVSAVAVAAYFGTRWYLSQQSTEEHQRRFSARPERDHTIADASGNYDIDGVSFDDHSSQVVVSGDGTHGEDPKRSVLLH